MKKSWFLLFFFFVILISLNCAKKEQRFVALVGEEKITVDEFNLKLKNRVRQIPPTREDELTLRKNVLERCVQEKLLAQAAKEMGRDQDETFINAVKEKEENFLVQELYNREVLEKSEPTERELKEFYKKQAEEIHARQILVKSRSKAEEVYQRLTEGANFEEIAKEESEDVATKDKGGDLGFFQWGKAVGPFQEAAFKLKPQEISKPVKTPFGWHIIKLEERRAVEQPEFETIRESLENTLRTFKQQELSYIFIEDLKRKSGFKANSTTLGLLIDKAEKPDTLQAKPTNVAEFDPAKFTPEEKDLVLSSFNGGELRLGAFLDNYHMIPAFRRPSLDEELLEDLIYQMSLKPILVQVAQDRKIDKSDGYLNALNDFKDMTLSNGYQYEILWKDISSTEEEVKDYYEKNKDLYLSPPATRVKEIMVKTEAEAQKLLKELKEGGDWDKLAMERTLRSHVRSRGGDLGFVNEKIYPEIFNYAWNNDMKVDEIAGPIHIIQSRYGEGYSVIKFLEKKDSYQRTLGEVRKDVETRLMNEKKSKALDDWLAEVKKDKEVKIFEEVLESTVEAKE